MLPSLNTTDGRRRRGSSNSSRFRTTPNHGTKYTSQNIQTSYLVMTDDSAFHKSSVIRDQISYKNNIYTISVCI